MILERYIIEITFDPSRGDEIKKRRPALIVSNDEYNKGRRQSTLCPITSTKKEGFYLVLYI
ncbi:type II toxin-antitoxin system PemK/MazF family toxin [Xylocopilactobacillus apis]|uniref:type II toxin-antitoxin system PemK/MazF family toxin n=1 Tax=Xylocopilactobacillus apis TaxID=2932183 RepID=UPI0029536F98|nr:type II toxin-antitoxin system PemK/MazF family toxin [Xylocopilactobacillus apis]